MYTVYKTVNLVNGKYYIGVHKTDNPYDDYIGSGKLIKRAIKKYGKDSFHKEIIAIFENKDDAYTLEASLVVICDESYNLKHGGEGGFDWINANGLTSSKTTITLTNEGRIKGGHSTALRYKTDSNFRQKKDLASGNSLRKYNVTFAGRQHSDEAKHKIGIKNKISQSGENNSQFGTCWVTNGDIDKKISKIDLDIYLMNGWIRGRKSRSSP